MKIVYLHNYYVHRGGEDISFEQDLTMLREEGHEVVPFTRHNSDFTGNPISLASKTLWNRATQKDLAVVLKREQPDLVHCNNLFPQISVSVYQAARKAKIPIVQALRNYRSFCSNSFLFREQQVCQKCIKSPLAIQGIRHACYRDSRAASAVVAGLQAFQHVMKIRERYVDSFVTPSEFSRQIHIQGGFDPANLFVRPNFILPDLGSVDHATLPRGAVFVGRLSKEKGIDILIDAWTRHGIDMPLTIVGEGEIEGELKQQASEHPQIQFVGQRSTSEVLELIGNAACLVMPSRWYETFGRTIVESFSRGTPVIASRLGAMAELADDKTGFQFEPGDSDDLAKVVNQFRSLTDAQQMVLRSQCRTRYEQNYSRDQSYERLMHLYRTTLSRYDSKRSVGREQGTTIQKRLPILPVISNTHERH